MIAHRNRAVASSTLFICVVTCLSLSAAIPRGWYLQGSNPADYDVAVDHEAEYSNNASVVLRSKQLTADGFGTLMQQFRAENYRGKRVRLSGSVKAEAFKIGRDSGCHRHFLRSIVERPGRCLVKSSKI
jgi:hypothetical protein